MMYKTGAYIPCRLPYWRAIRETPGEGPLPAAKPHISRHAPYNLPPSSILPDLILGQTDTLALHTILDLMEQY